MTPRLRFAIPQFASLDIGRTIAFFERLQFRRVGAYPDYAIIERNGVQLHFWLCKEPRIPKETGCRIARPRESMASLRSSTPKVSSIRTAA